MNSNWTYLQYPEFNKEIKWNAVIYVYKSNTKSYNPTQKFKTKKNNNKIEVLSSTNRTKKKCNIKDYFDVLSDSE